MVHLISSCFTVQQVELFTVRVWRSEVTYSRSPRAQSTTLDEGADTEAPHRGRQTPADMNQGFPGPWAPEEASLLISERWSSPELCPLCHFALEMERAPDEALQVVFPHHRDPPGASEWLAAFLSPFTLTGVRPSWKSYPHKRAF